MYLTNIPKVNGTLYQDNTRIIQSGPPHSGPHVLFFVEISCRKIYPKYALKSVKSLSFATFKSPNYKAPYILRGEIHSILLFFGRNLPKITGNLHKATSTFAGNHSNMLFLIQNYAKLPKVASFVYEFVLNSSAAILRSFTF